MLLLKSSHAGDMANGWSSVRLRMFTGVTVQLPIFHFYMSVLISAVNVPQNQRMALISPSSFENLMGVKGKVAPVLN
jgi:hypothetical protein